MLLTLTTRTRIRFQFEPDKALEAIAYLLSRMGGETDKVKLTKLLYLADRDHFIKHGYPITGDMQYALPKGPVPTQCLNLLNGEYLRSWDEVVSSTLDMVNHQVKLKAAPKGSRLTGEERATLDHVIAQHGRKNKWALCDETHELPEYKEVYVEGTSRPIPYELILQHYGGETGFRHDRPVVSQATMAKMISPFPSSEDDL